MPKEPFMLVSLNEQKAQKLSQVLSNKTATKILDYLSGNDATETELSKKLKIPLSTVHYNLQQLVEAKLVVVEEFHYSEKGKEVNHYTLANKYIIIAPEEEKEGLVDHLKKFIPVTLLTVGFAAILKTAQFMTGTMRVGGSFAAMESGDRGLSVQESLNKAAMDVATAEKSARTAADAAGAIQAAVPESAPLAEAGDALMTEGASRTMGAVANNPPVPLEGVIRNATIAEQSANTAADASSAVADSLRIAQDAVAQMAADEARRTTVVPWWQSDVIDYLILGALAILVLFIAVETFLWWRRKT